MPWLSIVMWLVSFLAAGGTKSGQAGKAALIATGVAAATWYGVDPANPDAAWDIFKADASAAADRMTSSPVTTQGVTRTVTGAASGWGSADNLVSTTGKVLTSWGPAGTLGVVTGTAAVTRSGIFSDIPSWVLYAGGGFLLYKILK